MFAASTIRTDGESWRAARRQSRSLRSSSTRPTTEPARSGPQNPATSGPRWRSASPMLMSMLHTRERWRTELRRLARRRTRSGRRELVTCVISTVTWSEWGATSPNRRNDARETSDRSSEFCKCSYLCTFLLQKFVVNYMGALCSQSQFLEELCSLALLFS
ncbi:unnamed protein product [Linum tenue]|uniref:Uncharacterized protein n=1 Tax=Linum tenue TaxID=586396 RepID=A0AAV0PUZ8_9ROSI|nr:unnamed protein product [Linum tenue]